MDETLTREPLAVMLAAVVNYDKLAEFLDQDEKVNKLADAKALTHPGAVAVTLKLGLLQPQNGKFLPQQPVTKAEAAAVLMRLVKLQGHTDQPIGQE
ncbi:S-layer homology domain-containing protein [Paenibacillus sp. TH7-28]